MTVPATAPARDIQRPADAVPAIEVPATVRRALDERRWRVVLRVDGDGLQDHPIVGPSIVAPLRLL
jgi:hypothetical protein